MQLYLDFVVVGEEFLRGVMFFVVRVAPVRAFPKVGADVVVVVVGGDDDDVVVAVSATKVMVVAWAAMIAFDFDFDIDIDREVA